MKKLSDNIDIDKLLQLTNNKFTKEEVVSFIDSCAIIASKTVIHAVIHVIEESPSKGFDKSIADDIVSRLHKLILYNYCGHISMTFEEITYPLKLFLTIVDKDYKTDIAIPHKRYVNELCSKYEALRKLAVTYWQQFIINNYDLHNEIKSYRPDVNFDNLTVDPENITTMYFDPNSSKRIGIFCRYFDDTKNKSQ